MSETLRYVHGLAELEANFRKVSAEVGKKVLRSGAGAGAKMVKSSAKGNVRSLPRRIPSKKPGHPGLLEKAAIINFRRRESNETQAVYIVTFRQGKKQQSVRRGKQAINLDAFYARWVEGGHKIVPRSKKVGTRGGKNRYAHTLKARRTGSTGMVKPYPFLRPALETNVDRVVERMADVVRQEFAKVLP